MSRLQRAAARLLFAAILLGLLGLTLAAFAGVARLQPAAPDGRIDADTHILHPPAWMDGNANRVDDHLERKYRQERQAGLQGKGGPAAADLLICLDHAPAAADLARYQAMGATDLKAWSDLIYVLRARFPAARLRPEALERLGQGPGVVWVEENAVQHADAYLATRQTGARRAWSLGFEGSPDQSIAVLDTGIDATHPDMASRIIAWADFAGADALVEGDEYPTPMDKNGHGTSTAGLAAGDGSAAGISSGVGTLSVTYPLRLSTFGGSSLFPIDTTAATGPIALAARLRWNPELPGALKWIQLAGSPASGLGLLGEAVTPVGASQPLTLTVPGIPAGLFSTGFTATGGTTEGNIPALGWLQVSTPMSAVGDGRRLMCGVAPGCKIVAVKVLDDNGSTPTSVLLTGLSWVNANRRALNIVCINASLGGFLRDALEEALVNQMVGNGVVWVNAAGNDREAGREGIFAPGSAARAITVGATDDQDSVAEYSSYGKAGQGKPDLVAPGGSIGIGQHLLVSPDSNSADTLSGTNSKVADQFPNDYRDGRGTSFASPLVAGGVMLIAQALGTWTSTEAQALTVKMLLLMTASETGAPAAVRPHPTLDRGAKDISEGFGRANFDAAIEAVTQSFTPGASASVSLGPGPLDKKVWARNVTLTAGTPYSFGLNLPSQTDYDLYLYSGAPITIKDADGKTIVSEGEPQIAASSTRALPGGNEAIPFTPQTTGLYYLVVKYVAGSGGAAQVISATPAADFVLSLSPSAQTLEMKGESVTYTVSGTALGGFNSPISLSTAGTLPAGTTAQLNPPAIDPGGTSVLTIGTSAATPGGSLRFTIQGAAGAVTHTATARLEAVAIWPRFHHDARGTARSALVGPQSAHQTWIQFPADAMASSPAVGGDGTVYCGVRHFSILASSKTGGGLIAMRPTDGKKLWTYDIPGGASVDSSPAIAVDGTIYFGADDGLLYALYPNGTEKWRLSLGSAPVRSAPVAAPDGTIYVTAGGNLSAVRPEGTLKWRFTSGGSVNSSPALGPDGTIYFGAGSTTDTAANKLFAISDTGAEAQTKWDFDAVGNVLSSPLVAPNGRIYFGSDGDGAGGRFYVLSDASRSATKVAEVTTGGAVQSSAAWGADNSAYVGCSDNNLYAFTADGALKWGFQTQGAVVSSPAVGADGVIYVGSRDKSVYALRDQGSSATKLWSANIGGEVQASPAIGANGALYIATLNVPGLGALGGLIQAYQAGPTDITVSPSISLERVGVTLTYTVSVTTTDNSLTSGTLAIEGTLPPGVTATLDAATVKLSSGRGQSKLTIATSSATAAGNFIIRLRLSAGAAVLASAQTQLNLTEYTLAGQPGTQRLNAGRGTAFSVLAFTNPKNGYPPFDGEKVNLSAAIVSGPVGATPPALVLEQTSATIPALVTLTAATTAGTTPGTYVLEVRGSARSVTRTTQFQLEVLKP